MRDCVDVVIIASGTTKGVSGGDLHSFRLGAYMAGSLRKRVGIGVVPSVAELLPAYVAELVREDMVTAEWSGRSMLMYPAVLVVRLGRIVARGPRAQVVVVASHFLNDVFCLLWYRLRFGAQGVVHVHHLISQQDRSSGVRDSLSRVAERVSLWFVVRSSAFVAVGDRQAVGHLVKCGVDPGRVVLLDFGVDSWGAPWECRFDAPERYILSVGRLAPSKGAEDLVNLASLLVKNGVDARVVVVGGGELEAQLREGIRDRGIDNVVLRGSVSDDVLGDLYRSATAFVSLSREEGYGLAVEQALRSGIPTVAYEIPALNRIREHALLVKSGSVDGVADALTRVLGSRALYREASSAALSYKGKEWDEALAGEIAGLIAAGLKLCV